MTELVFAPSLAQATTLPAFKPKVLWLEDDPDFSYIFIQYLSLRGYNCLHFSDPIEFLEYILANQIAPDLIISDMNLNHPTHTGAEVVIRLRKLKTYAKVPILVLTNYPDHYVTILGFKPISYAAKSSSLMIFHEMKMLMSASHFLAS